LRTLVVGFDVSSRLATLFHSLVSSMSDDHDIENRHPIAANQIRSQSPKKIEPPLHQLQGVSRSVAASSMHSSLGQSSVVPRFNPYNDDNRRLGGILRDGERMEGLFGLDRTSTDEYRQLCRLVTDASYRVPSLEPHNFHTALPEIAAWRRLLEIRSADVHHHDQGANLLRLHRRATARLNRFLCDMPEDTSLRDHLFHIWLSFVSAQRVSGNLEDARRTLRLMYTIRLGAINAALYVAQADLAESDSLAKEALHKGIENKAEPSSDLYNALSKWNQQTSPSINKKSPDAKASDGRIENARETTTEVTTNSKGNETTGIASQPVDHGSVQDSDMSMDTGTVTLGTAGKNAALTTTVDAKESIHFNLAPLLPRKAHGLGREKFDLPALGGVSLRRKFGQDIASRVTPRDESNGNVGNASDLSKIKPQLAARSDESENRATTRDDAVASFPIRATSFAHPTDEIGRDLPNRKRQHSDHSTHISGSSEGDERRAHVSSTPNPPPKPPSTTVDGKTPARPPSTQKMISFPLGPIPTAQRPLLTFKAFGLGKAEQAEQTTPSADPADKSAAPIEKKFVKMTPPRPKIVKQDLAYMWNWDPDKRRATSSSEPSSGPSGGDQGRPSISSSNGSNSTHTNELHISGSSNATEMSLAQPEGERHHLPSHKKASAGETQTARMPMNDEVKSGTGFDGLDQVNMDFLPLAREDNMIRVNGVPYAKLGIIGRGGSCKVYRVLSRDHAVLAIKRVKLENLDKRAIEGYSNEIALLKRLRGTPTIIQLHDSEVDYDQKAIFLVMEQGEVDLNQVLQRQATNGGPNGGKRDQRSLSMTFIRMTWQVRIGRARSSKVHTVVAHLLRSSCAAVEANAHCRTIYPRRAYSSWRFEAGEFSICTRYFEVD
jgi:Protein kinase domain